MGNSKVLAFVISVIVFVVLSNTLPVRMEYEGLCDGCKNPGYQRFSRWESPPFSKAVPPAGTSDIGVNMVDVLIVNVIGVIAGVATYVMIRRLQRAG